MCLEELRFPARAPKGWEVEKEVFTVLSGKKIGYQWTRLPHPWRRKEDWQCHKVND
jgi:hypothetical protein